MITELPSTPQSLTDELTPSEEELLAMHEEDQPSVYLKTTKKYKPVALKTKPVLGELPEKFRIIRNIKGDPLEHLPTLNPNPPKYSPYGRYTQERKDFFDNANSGFLWPAERSLPFVCEIVGVGPGRRGIREGW